MWELPRSLSLLRRVALRLRVQSFCRRFYVALLVFCGFFAAALLTVRLTGLVPDRFEMWTLGVVPAAALLVSLLSFRRPTLLDAARVVDTKSRTKDLYLTVALLDQSVGDYKPLVARDAERHAQAISPAVVVPFGWERRILDAAAALALLAAALWYVPQLDPFGKVAQAAAVEEEKKELEESKRATLVRTAQIKRDRSEGENSEAVKKAVEDLKSSLNKMKPTQKKSNFKVLASHQKRLGGKWQQINAEKLKDLFQQKMSSQSFGGANQAKLEKWTRELQEGSTESLKKELEQLKGDLQKLLKTKDPVERQKLAQKIKKRMKDLDEFASNKVNSKPLSAALKRAMKQLELSKKFDGLSSEESLQSVEQSLNLAKMELQEIAQSAKDLKKLEEALETIQMAKKANEAGQLDGQVTEGMQSLEDYAEMYAQMMGGQPGQGGLGGEGFGEGGEAPEDDSVKTGFKSEQTKVAVQAGKVLLSLKTKGLSDTGDAVRDYRGLVTNVKQGVSEAILRERIPPGYHDGIKKYFDNLEEELPPPGR